MGTVRSGKDRAARAPAGGWAPPLLFLRFFRRPASTRRCLTRPRGRPLPVPRGQAHHQQRAPCSLGSQLSSRPSWSPPCRAPSAPNTEGASNHIFRGFNGAGGGRPPDEHACTRTRTRAGGGGGARGGAGGTAQAPGERQGGGPVTLPPSLAVWRDGVVPRRLAEFWSSRDIPCRVVT